MTLPQRIRSSGKELVRTTIRFRGVNYVIRLFRRLGRTPLSPLVSRIPVVGEVDFTGGGGQELVMISDGLDSIAARVFWGGLDAYEPGVFRTLRSCLSDTDATAVDIGANTGLFTLFLAGMGFRTVIAFEPVPGVYSRMCRNVKRNGFRNVETVRAAVLDRTGEVTLHVPDVVPVPSSASVKGGFWPVTRPVVAACTSLDAFLSGRGDPAVSFVKIDVEGAALEALSGMRTTLARWQPMILCEVLPQDSRPELDALLSACGYRAYCVTERGVQPVDAFATWRFAPWEINFLLLPPGREWPPGASPEARVTESPSPLDSAPPRP